MNDYETSYEEYKQALLQNHWFIKTLHEKYRGSMIAEKDYIDTNGVLWKIGTLGAVCGFCTALTFALAVSGLWFLGVILFFAIIGSMIWARHIEAKFKKDSGELNFYAFRYYQHFKDKVQEDKDSEMKKLLEDILKKYEYSRFRDNIAVLAKEDLEALLKQFISDTDEFKKRYHKIAKYDDFARSLKGDYYFNAEIQKNIDKYV